MWHKWRVSICVSSRITDRAYRSFLQHLVEAYEDRGSDIETFVKDFSEDGRLMNITKINAVLTQQRVKRDERDATDARQLFGKDLGGTNGRFTYVKQGVTRTITDKAIIARRWRELLKDDAGVRREWEQKKAEMGYQ